LIYGNFVSEAAAATLSALLDGGADAIPFVE
jgi:hypothetical protein